MPGAAALGDHRMNDSVGPVERPANLGTGLSRLPVSPQLGFECRPLIRPIRQRRGHLSGEPGACVRKRVMFFRYVPLARHERKAV